jgi:hypothetical protein
MNWKAAALHDHAMATLLQRKPDSRMILTVVKAMQRA